MDVRGDGELTLVELQARLLASIATRTLEQHLREAALNSLTRALAAVADDWVEACFQAGQALEHLAKAVVFADNPAALTKKSKRPSIDFLTGAGHPDVQHLGQIYTIPGPDAVLAAMDVLDLPEPDDRDLQLAFEARNAAAHLGYAEFSVAPGAVGGALRLVRQLLTATGDDLGRCLEDEQLSRIAELLMDLPQGKSSYPQSHEARVRAQIWRARQVVEDLRSRLPSEAWLSLATRPRDPAWHEERELRPCPAGDHLAWYVVRWEEDDVQSNDDREHYRDEVAYLDGLDCSVCGLDLAGDDVEVLGLDERVAWRTVER